MAPCMICLILLQLLLLTNAQYTMTLHPMVPVIAVGGSVQLNCSINCPLGRTSWKGLDTNLNGQYTAPGYSVQTIENASISMEGTRICVGTCPKIRKNLQASVILYVYVLPEALLLSYSMKNGLPYLDCSMRDAYPPPSEISCYRWSEKLGDPNDENMEANGEYLTTFNWSWELGDEDRISETLYRCEATVVFGDYELKREGTLKISQKGANQYTSKCRKNNCGLGTFSCIETPAASTVTSTSQSAITTPRSLETSYVKTTVASSTDHQTMQESTALGNELSTFLDKHITNTSTQNNKTFTFGSPVSQETDFTTSESETHSARTDFTDPPITSQGVPQTSPSMLPATQLYSPKQISTLRTPWSPAQTAHSVHPNEEENHNRSINKDELILITMIGPAAGLAGSILLFLQIWKHLNKKGFFQPKQIDGKGIQEKNKSQDYTTSLVSVYSHHT